MRILATIVFFLSLVVVCRGEPSDLFTDLPFPAGTSFGMSPRDIQKARPVVKFRDGSGGTGMFAAAEIIPQENGVIAGYIYHFKEGKLAAVTYNRALTNMLADAETKRLYMKLLSSKYALDTLQTARMGQVFTVKRWKDAKSRVDVYLEATTRGTTITFVSADIFAVGELFPSVAEKDRQAAILEKQERSFGRAEKEPNRSIDRLSPDAPPQALLIGE